MIFGNNDDIEILDLDEVVPVRGVDKNANIIEEVDKDINKKEKKNKEKKNVNKKTLVFQYIFCSISFLFIIGCCIFYGSRLFKYYRVYNPKPSSGGETVSLLANEITSKSEIVYEGSGLYISGGNYIYKGDVSNNYVKYNNMLWRIVKINRDDTINLILDDYINVLNWDNMNSDYVNSNIYDYLNNYFVNSLNKDLLTTLSVCTDKFDSLTDLSCDNKSDGSLVNLLDVSNFLNSIVDGNSYLAMNSEIFWLSNQGSEKVWHTNGVNVSVSDGNSFYEIRPMITLKGATAFYSGNGSKETPYIVEEENKKISVGSYIKLDEDVYQVYDVSKNIKMTLSKNLDKQYHFSYNKTSFDVSDKDSLAEYLNTTYLDSLSYKDMLVEDEWYNGTFKGLYSDITKDKVKAKVGILNLMDLKLNSGINNYLLMTSNSDELIYTYGEVLKTGKSTIYRNIRPCISLSKDVNIKEGNGSLNNPFVLEVK